MEFTNDEVLECILRYKHNWFEYERCFCCDYMLLDQTPKECPFSFPIYMDKGRITIEIKRKDKIGL